MAEQLQLYMLLLGCKPEGRHTEQHDLFFGIGPSLKSLIGQMESFWPEAGKIHLDAWRVVSQVNEWRVSVKERVEPMENAPQPVVSNEPKLFFLNLGGYKPGVFEEFHYKELTVQSTAAAAIKAAKSNAFYQHSVSSHIDDKYGVDVDDLYNVEDILDRDLKKKYFLAFEQVTDAQEDEWHIGYTKLTSLT